LKWVAPQAGLSWPEKSDKKRGTTEDRITPMP
jgi:hypothetical protein